MFVRKRKNKSGSISVVVTDKSGGRFRELKTIGIATTAEEVGRMEREAHEWIARHRGQHALDFDGVEQKTAVVGAMLDGVEKVLINGPQLLLGRIYDEVGFGDLGDDVLRHLVIARICQPSSKLATVEYLKSYYDEDVAYWHIYRYMDRLYDTQRERVQQISVEHTRRMLGGGIGLMFYDVTSLYFETPGRDELREPGFSKDGKTSESQIILGLLVSRGGYPLSYSIYNGSQYEGRTMIPLIDDFRQRFRLEDFVVVADSGLMSKTNVRLLEEAGYRYIIGARIKNESESVKEWVLSLDKRDGGLYERPLDGGRRLVVGYSAKRAAKDAHNRDSGVAKLSKRYSSGTLTKSQLNNRGYNKFLEITNDVHISISAEKIAQDKAWDGLKGYITNTALPCDEIVEQYHGLWVVERAFRISKGNLEMRPIFHFTERRIEAHICICFVAYKVYKELERIVRERSIGLSVDKVIAIAKTITTITVKVPGTDARLSRTLFLTPRQQQIKPLFP